MLKNNLKEIRRSKNISQEEVAQALHISRQSLSKWENQREILIWKIWSLYQNFMACPSMH